MLKELNNIFHVKDLNVVLFVSTYLTIGKRSKKKNIDLLNLTQKVNV